MKVTGGTARMTIAPIGDDALPHHLRRQSSGGFSRFFKVRDEIETIVARADFSTLRYIKRLDERGDKMDEVTDHRRRRRHAQAQEDQEGPGPASRLRSDLRHLSLPHARARAREDRTSSTLISDGKLYTVHARVVRREKVHDAGGHVQTRLLVEPQMVSGGVQREERLFIWYSDDERRSAGAHPHGSEIRKRHGHAARASLPG